MTSSSILGMAGSAGWWASAAHSPVAPEIVPVRPAVAPVIPAWRPPTPVTAAPSPVVPAIAPGQVEVGVHMLGDLPRPGNRENSLANGSEPFGNRCLKGNRAHGGNARQ